MKIETITSRQNPLLIHVRKLLRSRSYRESCGEYIAEGTKLLEEALLWQAGVKTILLDETVMPESIPSDVRVVRIPADIMRQLSLQQQPQGAMFVCTLPSGKNGILNQGCLILDGIQDPGNLGTILRTADALEIPVILTEGCADAYSPKTVRASMGAVFRTAPVVMGRQDVLAAIKHAGIPLLVTTMNSSARDIRYVDVTSAAVVIGSEGQGVCTEFLNGSDGAVIIPMNPRCESLNAAVAATIVMWQMKR